MKHQIVHALQKYVLNPPIKLLFAMGIVLPGYALLETIGRKSGTSAERAPQSRRTTAGCRTFAIFEGWVRSVKFNECCRPSQTIFELSSWTPAVLNQRFQ
jgi:hypothetical protein